MTVYLMLETMTTMVTRFPMRRKTTMKMELANEEDADDDGDGLLDDFEDDDGDGV